MLFYNAKKIQNLILKNIFDKCLANREKMSPNLWRNHIDKTVSNFLN